MPVLVMTVALSGYCFMLQVQGVCCQIGQKRYAIWPAP